MELNMSPGHDRRSTTGVARKALEEAFWSAICACIVSYCVVSFVAGQAGLLAYKDLQHTILLMQEKSNQLQQENSRLMEVKELLQNDTERIAVQAREIGYIRENEKMVILKTPSTTNEDDPNVLLNQSLASVDPDLEPVRAGYSSGLPDEMIKTLSALIALVIFFVSLISRIFQARTPRRLGAD